jgi:hypothetical protein
MSTGHHVQGNISSSEVDDGVVVDDIRRLLQGEPRPPGDLD